MQTRQIDVENMESIQELFGSGDIHIRNIEKKYGVTVVYRGSEVTIKGEDENMQQAEDALNLLLKLSAKGELSEQSVDYVAQMVEEGKSEELKKWADAVCVSVSGKPIRAKTINQREYINAIAENTIVLGIGPAGTGKTYLAVAMAVKAFKAHEVERIILTRPAVEAGEKLGFLPGDLQDKVDPYLRPLYDALFEMLGAENFAKYMEKGLIEVAPLAYMRGRTLDNAFIILDEAQNTTGEQIKMFLTRLGNHSKMVITGDITQIDLPDSKKSGLLTALKVLRNIDDIQIHRFSEKDVVRHKLVMEIIRAYDRYENKEESCANTKEITINKGEN